MKRKLIIAIPTTAVLIAGAAGIAVAADNKGNDRVLTGTKNEFIEVFRRDDPNGDKNYQYTITEFKDKWGRNCTVVTGDSEKAIALDCDKVDG
jgi:hypothetical protein